MQMEWAGRPADVREIGSGKPVLLVHGYPLDGAMWSGVARALSTQFRVLKPDLPGRGNTEAPAPDSIEGYAGFLEGIVGQLEGSVGLAGFSFGGYITMALLKRRPEKIRALALVDTRASADDEAGRRKRDETIAAVRSNGLAPVLESMPLLETITSCRSRRRRTSAPRSSQPTLEREVFQPRRTST